MQTTLQRPSRARKPAAAPFGPAVARLIQQVQAEAREQLLADLSAGDTITVLHGFDAATKRVRADGNSINISDTKGNAVRLHRHHDEPENWRGKDYMAGYWHPARWYGRQTLVDASGIEWERDFKPLVCDDFGNLVELPQ